MVHTSTPRWIMINHDTPLYFTNSGGLNAGQVRYNPNVGFEIYDGTSWHAYMQDWMINLRPEAELALDWAARKMQEERDLDKLLEKHPGLRESYDRYRIMLKLVQESPEEQD